MFTYKIYAKLKGHTRVKKYEWEVEEEQATEGVLNYFKECMPEALVENVFVVYDGLSTKDKPVAA